MQIAVTGSSGLVGSALVSSLETAGHEVLRVVRTEKAADQRQIVWNPKGGTIDRSALEGCDALVHLAGESIAKGRWTAAKKARIRDSRVEGTALLSQALSQLQRPPKVWVSASAIGYYGDRGDETLREDSSPGTNFLADVCQQWEAATRTAPLEGIRVVTPRFGVVLSTMGGALATMLTPFKMGAGGVVGSGKQYMSWITLDDLVQLLRQLLTDESLQGPVNAVSPHPVTNREFTKALGKALSRPTIFPMPAFAARLALGEMADELLLASARVEPAKLLASGFHFQHTDLETALRHILTSRR